MHKVLPELKVLFIITMFSLIILEICLFKQVIFLAIIIWFFLSLNPSKMILRTYFLIILFTVLTTILFQSFFYYGFFQSKAVKVIFQVIPPDFPIIEDITLGKGIALTYEGVLYGGIVSLKIVNTMLLALLFTLTTLQSEFFAMFQRLRIPWKIIITSLVSIKFIPIIVEEYHTLLLL